MHSIQFCLGKKVKQSCLISSLLFNICIDPLHEKKNHKYAYSTNEFQCKLIQAYADNGILISSTAEGL
jgi:hypothetical protein